MKAVRRALLAGLLVLLAGLAASVRRFPPLSGWFAVRTWSPAGGSALLEPGLSFCPTGLCRVARFPDSPVALTIRIGAGAGSSATLRSREGAGLFAAGSMRLQPDRRRPVDLARAFPDGWGPDAAQRIAAALHDPFALRAGQGGFSDLIDPTLAAAPAMPEGVLERLSAMGLRLAEPATLRFYPAPESTAPAAAAPRKVLLVGLDGADWEIIDPLIEQGRMPHLAGLLREGVRARLKTLTPVLSPIIWTSIATGVGPERHGILDFLATSKTTGNQIPVTSNMRRVKALWSILTERGLSSGVVAWWATWPAESVDGYIVSDRVAYQLFGVPDAGESMRRQTFPEALALAIHTRIVAPGDVSDQEVARFVGPGAPAGPVRDDLTQRLRTIVASSRTYSGIGLELMAAYDPVFKAIYLEGTDTIAHNFMRYRPPRMPGVTEPEVAAFGGVVDRFYEYTDEVLGSFLAQADERTVVVLCSDHGFRTGANRPASDPRIEAGGAADWHRKFGILAMAGPGIRKDAKIDDASVLDIAPTILAVLGLPVARDMPGRVLEEAFESRPVPERIASYETEGAGRQGGGSDEPIGSAIDREIVAKLTALGYVGVEGTNALNNSGITLLDKGRFAEAADVFRRAIAREPRFVHARVNLARAQMLLKQYDAATATLKDVLALDPNQGEVHNLLGNIHMSRGDYAAAESAFRTSLRMHPNDTNAHNSLGLLYDQTGRDEMAIAEYRKVVSIDPDYAEGYNNIGLIYRKEGQPQKAIEQFEQAIRADPDFPGSYNNMGLAWQDLGRLDQARAAFERGLAVDAGNAVILNNLGTVDLAEKRYEAARSRFEEAIRADPEYPSAYNNLGAVLGMMGRGDEAFEQYLKAVEIDPNYCDGRFNLARALVERDKTEEAIEMLRKVLAIDARYARAYLQLGMLLARRGDLDGAQRQLARAAGLMPNSPDPHNLLAEIHLKRGEGEEARRELLASLAIHPEQPQVRQMLEKLRSGAPQAP